MKGQKDGLQSENYKRLLDLLMQLDNKMKQTNQSIVADVRQEFIGMLNQRDQTRDEQQRADNQKLLGQLGALEGSIGDRSAIDEVRREMENVIKSGHKRNDNNYAKLLEVLSELERKQDSKFSGLIAELKSNLEGQMGAKVTTLEKTSA